ncbi:MAG: response regulator [Verrucomicrobiota bacterium]|nr:response regulator [Verrucomicrobiota bacterium]
MDNARIRILFVDDESVVLNGLRRALQPFAEIWEVDFTASGQEALARMRAGTYDVVVADMMMPGMNGAELLNKVMQLYPKVNRFITANKADSDMIMRCVGATHQFMPKPCDPVELERTLTRAAALDATLGCDRVREVIAKIDNLPAFPSLYKQVMDTLSNPLSSLDEVAELIARDIGVSAKILKLVNSAFFGLRREVSGVAEAILFLGLETVRGLLLSISTFDQILSKASSMQSLNALWEHCLAVAMKAKLIAEFQNMHANFVESAYTGGLLHDVGKLILITYLPDVQEQVISLQKVRKCPWIEAEQESYGSNHAEIGAYLLALWGLPAPLVEAVLHHHQPSKCSVIGISPLMLVHVANGIWAEQHPSPFAKPIAIDMSFLRSNGCLDKLQAWRRL